MELDENRTALQIWWTDGAWILALARDTQICLHLDKRKLLYSNTGNATQSFHCTQSSAHKILAGRVGNLLVEFYRPPSQVSFTRFVSVRGLFSQLTFSIRRIRPFHSRIVHRREESIDI